MNNILLVAGKLLRQLFRKKSSIIIYIILPVIGVLIPLLMFSNHKEALIRVGVVNRDSGFLSDSLIDDLSQQKRFKVSDVAESSVNADISGGKLDCAIIIPEGFTQSYLDGSIKTIEIVSVQGIAATGWVEGYLESVLPQIELLSKAANSREDTFQALYNEFSSEVLPVSSLSVQNKATGFTITYLGLGFLIQFVLLGSQRTVSLIIKERKEKTLSRILCAPVKGYEFISGNVIVNVSLITLQTLIVLFVLHYILGIDMGASPLVIMAILFPLLIASVGITLMLASFSKNENQLSLISTMVIYPTCLISGCFWDVEIMPQFMQKLSHLLPQRWTLDAIEIVMTGKELADVSVNLLVISAFAVTFFAMAIYGFSRKESNTV